MRKSAPRAAQPAPSTCSSRRALPKCNPEQSEPPPLQQSIIPGAVHGRTTFTAARIDARTSGTRGPSEDAHRPSPRPTLPHSLACVAERAAADHTSSAQRRADELLAAGASRTSSRTTTQPMARSAPAQRASSSARCRGGDHHRGTIEACGACGSCAEVPSAGMCGCVGGLDAGGVVFGDSTAHAALGGGWGAAVEERVSATCVTDQLCTKYSQHEPGGGAIVRTTDANTQCSLYACRVWVYSRWRVGREGYV